MIKIPHFKHDRLHKKPKNMEAFKPIWMSIEEFLEKSGN